MALVRRKCKVLINFDSSQCSPVKAPKELVRSTLIGIPWILISLFYPEEV